MLERGGTHYVASSACGPDASTTTEATEDKAKLHTELPEISRCSAREGTTSLRLARTQLLKHDWVTHTVDTKRVEHGEATAHLTITYKA